MKKEIRAILLLLCATLALTLQAQDIEDPGSSKNLENVAMPHFVKVEKTFYKGDSIPAIRLIDPVYKYPPLTFKNEEEKARYNRLVENIKKLLPLAKMARYTIIETYNYVETLPDKRSRDAHWKRVEQDLVNEYKPMVRRLTRSQGRLLIKLVDRECNQTGLSIARAFLGTARANFYQGIGWVFGLNLNKHYDPNGDDRLTERVCRLVESGQI